MVAPQLPPRLDRLARLEARFDGPIPADLLVEDHRRAGFFETCASIRLHRRIYKRVTRELDERLTGARPYHPDRVAYCLSEIDFCQRQLARLYRYLARYLEPPDHAPAGTTSAPRPRHPLRGQASGS
ncbi:MAG: hypothetical protein ACE5LL_05110 [Alphaproteobacteria bacterium]